MRRVLALGAVFLLSGSFAVAQDAAPITVPAPAVKERTEKVMTAYDWSGSVEELEERAQKTGKLIFWLQIVGKLDDGL